MVQEIEQWLRRHQVFTEPAYLGEYCAANYLIQICILFDTTGIQTTANYLIPNSPSFDSF